MRVGPSGGKWYTPIYMVPTSLVSYGGHSVKPHHLRFFGAQRFSASRNLSVRLGTKRLKTSEEVITAVRSVVPCRSATSANLNTRNMSEASVERLIPLVDHLAAWKFLPNVSQWVLSMVQKDYIIQFSFRPHRFNGVLPTVAGPSRLW